jgi:hypothetical protein
MWRAATATLALLMVVTQAVGQDPEPAKPKPKAKKVGPMQIDFTPLVGADKEDFKVSVVVTSEKGDQTKVPIHQQGTPTPGTIADCFKDSLHKGWDGERDGALVRIKGFRGSPVKSVKVEVIGLDKKYKPVVTRLKP